MCLRLLCLARRQVTWEGCVPQVALLQHAGELDDLVEHVVGGELATERSHVTHNALLQGSNVLRAVQVARPEVVTCTAHMRMVLSLNTASYVV
jgi:hypothetical protein